MATDNVVESSGLPINNEGCLIVQAEGVDKTSSVVYNIIIRVGVIKVSL